MAIDLSKFIQRFIEEARDHLDRLHQGLSELDQQQGTADTIHGLFRSAHTIKGSSRMLKLLPITDTAHHMEDLLSTLREGKQAYTPDIGQLLHTSADAIAQLVDQLQATQKPTDLPDADPQLLARLKASVQGDSTAADSTTPTPAAASHSPTTTSTAAAQTTPAPTNDTPPNSAEPTDTTHRLKTPDTIRIRLEKLDELLGLMSEVVSSHSRLRQRLRQFQQLERLATTGSSAPQQTLYDLQHRLHVFGQQLRDDVQIQEQQMHDLLDRTLLIRMLPLSIVLDPAARTARELATSVGKQLICHVHGNQIELDRQLIDKLADPLLHLVRNAIDHGLESPEQRQAAGKPAQGRLTLSAQQDGSWVLLEVGDDGKGLSLDSIRTKAIRKGLVSSDAALTLSDQDVIDFIFQPGFSTADIITDLSGRGVGMDVVKKTIVDDLQGNISVDTQPNRGTRFLLRLPMSLAVMRILLIQDRQTSFGLSAQYVAEILRVPRQRLMSVAERQTVIIRNEFVPVVALHDILPGQATASAHTRQEDSLLLIVLRVHTEKLAIAVEDLLDERELVIKPLPAHLQGNQLVSGMVIDGDNQLISVLHAPALLTLARQSRQKAQRQQQNEDTGTANTHAWHILVVDDSLNTREIEKDVLEAHGYLVTLAEDGMDGLNKAREGDFDAILTDVEMPNMDGFTLTAHLRQEEKYRERPIIIITSREKEEDKRRGVQAGADAYIVKGDFDQSSLIDTLHALLV